MKKVLLTALATAGAVGSFAAAAPSASAAGQGCSAAVTIAPGTTLVSCIGVDGSVHAQGVVTFTADAPTGNFGLSITIARTGSAISKTCTVIRTATVTQTATCDGVTTNPAGVQNWQAVATALGGTARSPVVSG